jgi:hypothetical protein
MLSGVRPGDAAVPAFIDLTGRTFGLLTVIERGPPVPGRGGRQATWVCSGSCGTERTRLIQGQRLRSGDTTSCGCVRRETSARTNRTCGKVRVHMAKIGQAVWPHDCPTCGTHFLGTARAIYCQPSCRPKYWKRKGCQRG